MNFLEINTKIEINLKQIEFYHSLYQKNQNKFSFLVIIYSFICFYLIEIIKYPFKDELQILDFAYIVALIVFLWILCLSLRCTFQLIKPIEVAYLNQPKYFYKQILEDYKLKLQTQDEDVLNEYLKVTYLTEIEEVLDNNITVYQTKSTAFYNTFKKVFWLLIMYIALSSFVIIQKRDDKNIIEIENYKEIIKHINKTKMAEEKSKDEKPKVDPNLVIKTSPKMINESITLNMERRDTTSTKKDAEKKSGKDK